MLLPLLLAACPRPLPSTAPEPVALPPREAKAPPADDLIYFVMVDRFANGEPGNDPPQTDRADPQAWHGGDLRGLIDHLDALAALGVKTLWLSPLSTSRKEKFFEWGAFHGYWVEELGALDPAFGTVAELHALREGLDDRGMRLVLDMVYNHVAMDSPLLAEHPDWFHPHGGVEDWQDPFQLQNHQVHGLPDLDQDNPEVYAKLLADSRWWLEQARPDGFRVDAVRHMPPEFLARLDADLGDVWMLGEYFEGDPVALQQSWGSGGFEAVFDFPLHYAMVDVFCKEQPVGRLASVLSSDRLYADPEGLVTFLDNHDLPRIASQCEDVDPALDFLFAVRGTPSLTWGTEVGLSGEHEPENRADMRFVEDPLQARIAELAARRRESPALSSGLTRVQDLDDQLLVLERVKGTHLAVIAVNTGEDAVLREVEGRTLELRPGVTVQSWELPDTRLYEELSTPSLGHSIRFELAPGVVVTGAGPELGNWDPAKGLKDGDRIVVPEGTVLEFKRVTLPDGWEAGPNHYLLVRDDNVVVMRD